MMLRATRRGRCRPPCRTLCQGSSRQAGAHVPPTCAAVFHLSVFALKALLVLVRLIRCQDNCWRMRHLQGMVGGASYELRSYVTGPFPAPPLCRSCLPTYLVPSLCLRQSCALGMVVLMPPCRPVMRRNLFPWPSALPPRAAAAGTSSAGAAAVGSSVSRCRYTAIQGALLLQEHATYAPPAHAARGCARMHSLRTGVPPRTAPTRPVHYPHPLSTFERPGRTGVRPCTDSVMY